MASRLHSNAVIHDDDRPTERISRLAKSNNSNLISGSGQKPGTLSSSSTTGAVKRRVVVEHHKKTMLKVMDPNVHQMTLSRN